MGLKGIPGSKGEAVGGQAVEAQTSEAALQLSTAMPPGSTPGTCLPTGDARAGAATGGTTPRPEPARSRTEIPHLLMPPHATPARKPPCGQHPAPDRRSD